MVHFGCRCRPSKQTVCHQRSVTRTVLQSVGHCLDWCWGGTQRKWSPILHTIRLYVFMYIITLKTILVIICWVLIQIFGILKKALLWEISLSPIWYEWPLSSSFSWENAVPRDLDWWSSTFGLSNPSVLLSVHLRPEKVRISRML